MKKDLGKEGAVLIFLHNYIGHNYTVLPIMLDMDRGIAYAAEQVKGSSDRRIDRRAVLRHHGGQPPGDGLPIIDRDLQDLYSPHDESCRG